MLLGFLFLSCEKLIEVNPPVDQIVNPLPFERDATAVAAVTGIYSEMMRSPSQFTSGLLTFYAGMSADELYYYSPGFRDEFVNNNLTQVNHSNITNYFWQPAYRFIYAANLIEEQLNFSAGLSIQAKNMLLGEVKFIRAFCYFNLVNLVGDVPLILNSDYRVNSTLSRSPVDNIFNQIINDLVDAKQLLQPGYATSERVRPNKWTAAALLARVYLYKEDWVKAEKEADEIISSGLYNLETDLDNVFIKDSEEAIWQLRPVDPRHNTWEGNAVLPVSTNSTPTYLITNELLNAFEPDDQRKAKWLNSRIYLGNNVTFPYKYKVFGNNAPLTEYYVIFRLSEQYLIRAEARVQLSNIDGAVSDLNVIRNRAGLPDFNSSSQSMILSAIFQERRIELFSEWGHRWFDLKRSNKANEILSQLKPTTWQSTDIFWPIPIDQINLNPKLTQNPGY